MILKIIEVEIEGNKCSKYFFQNFAHDLPDQLRMSLTHSVKHNAYTCYNFG